MNVKYMTNEYMQLILSEIFDLIKEIEKYSVYNDDILNNEVYGMRRRAERIQAIISEEEV